MNLLYRRALRRNLRAVLVTALLVGVVAGVGLWSLGAARRTASAFSRYLDSADASHVSIDVFPVGPAADLSFERHLALLDEAGAIPGVVEASTYYGMESMFFDGDLFENDSVEFVGSLDGRFVDQDRIAVVSGRLPDAENPGEVLVNEVAAAQRGLEVGDVAPVVVFETADGVFDINSPPAGRFEVEVVGIGVFADDVLDDEYDRLPRTLISRAATQQWLAIGEPYSWQGLRLANAGDVPRVVGAYRALLSEDEYLISLVTADQAAGVQRSVRPVVVALVAFGIVTLAASLAVGAIGVGRLVRTSASELRVLRGLGARPRAIAAILATPGVAAAVAIGLVAAAVTIVLSPLAPLGGVRAVEPSPGVDVDGLVVAGGAAVLLLALVLTAAAVAARTVALAGVRTTLRAAPAAGNLVASLTPAAAMGVRRGIGRSATTGAPMRTALAGCAVALATIVAALTFGAGLRQLLDDPHRYGWATDLALIAGYGYDVLDIQEVEDIAAAEPDVAGVAVAGFGTLEVAGVEVPALWMDARRGPEPVTLLAGRLPAAPNEVALGSVTADQLGAAVDGTVDGPSGSLDVVGIVALPAIGQVTSSHPSLGDGVLLSMAGIAAVDPEAQPSAVFLDLNDGVDASAVAGTLATSFARASDGGFVAPFTLLRPAELADTAEAEVTVGVVAGLLGVAAAAGLATVVAASVRARRRELAVLRTIGFTSGDLRRSVRWQAATTATLAAVIGVPCGALLGVVLWRAFAGTVGVDPAPVVPVILMLGTGPAAVGLAVLGALPAARRASQATIVAALRPE